MGSMLFMIVIIALMIVMMWFSSRRNRQQQTAVQDFRASLKPGDEVATSTGLLGKIVSVDQEKEQVVLDSEGSLSRWRIQAITKPPIVPAYVHDDEVDENGNPLPENADAPAEVTDAEDTAADDAATENSAASEDKDEAESKSDSEPEPEDESDKAETEDEEKSDDADESDASKDSKASDSTSAKS